MNHGQDSATRRPVYKSKAEVQIARLLDREQIAFQYEYPLAVMDRGQTRIWYPDFRLCDYGMIMEYFGMNGDPAYRKRAQHKIEVYSENGIEGVFLTEESFQGDWPSRVLGQIEGILQGRLDRFYGSGRRSTGVGNGRTNGPYFSGNKRAMQETRQAQEDAYLYRDGSG